MDQPVNQPAYFLILRAVQLLFGFIVFCIGAAFIHDAVTDELVFALVCGLFTLFVASFNIAVNRVTSLQKQPIILISIGADAILAIFWLTSMALNAHLRSILTNPVYCEAYVNSGSVVGSKYCILKRTNPFLVVGQIGLAEIDAVAVFSAFEFILFVSTGILSFLLFRNSRITAAPPEVEAPVQQTPGYPQQQPYVAYEHQTGFTQPYYMPQGQKTADTMSPILVSPMSSSAPSAPRYTEMPEQQPVPMVSRTSNTSHL